MNHQNLIGNLICTIKKFVVNRRCKSFVISYCFILIRWVSNNKIEFHRPFCFMMGFIFLGYKVEVKAVEMVGHIISERKPATKPTTQTIVK